MVSDAVTTEDLEAAVRAPIGISPTLLGSIVLGVLLLYFWISGTFLGEEDPGFWMTPLKATGSALTYSTTPAFLIAAIRAISQRTRTTLLQLHRSGTIDAAAAMEVLTGTGFGPGMSRNIAVTVVGLILGALNVPWDRVYADIDTPHALAAVSIAVGNLVTWLVVTHMAYRRISISNSVRKLGDVHAKVDLFRLDALVPFGRMGTFDLLVVAITLSFAVFQSIDADVRWENYETALAAGVPIGLGLLMLPMLGIRQNVRRHKRSALDHVDELIAHANRDLDPESMRYLGDLLHRRERLEKVREWPLDTTVLSRIAVYFIVPPLAWLGGALVEILLNAAIGSG